MDKQYIRQYQHLNLCVHIRCICRTIDKKIMQLNICSIVQLINI